VCMPGFYREQTVCVPCTDNYYCDGLDDSRQACPSNAVSNLAVGIENCLCQASYEAIFSSTGGSSQCRKEAGVLPPAGGNGSPQEQLSTIVRDVCVCVCVHVYCVD
jgi:hypothetical protein